jgi:hypothetical protein
MATNADLTERAPARHELGRRSVLGGAVAGFVLTAGGLLAPSAADETAAREGALGGALGGRHGKDHRGRHRRRSHGDKKDKGKGRNEAPPQSHGPFRASALTVVNIDSHYFPSITLNCTFYYRIKTGLDDYGPPVASFERTLARGESFRYAPDRFRVGVLIKHFITSHDVYADVRNKSLWLPTGGVTSGPDLDPPAGKTGSVLIREQAFDFNESHFATLPMLRLKRKPDSDTHIEWELTVTQI